MARDENQKSDIAPAVEYNSDFKLLKNKGFMFLVLSASFIMFSVAAM